MVIISFHDHFPTVYSPKLHDCLIIKLYIHSMPFLKKTEIHITQNLTGIFTGLLVAMLSQEIVVMYQPTSLTEKITSNEFWLLSYS